MNVFMELIIFVSIIALLLLILSAVLIKRGKRWMMGGRIIKTFIAENPTEPRKQKSRLKVHVVETRLPKAAYVGLELRQPSGFGMRLIPITLSVDEAEELSGMLRQAIDHYQSEETNS